MADVLTIGAVTATSVALSLAPVDNTRTLEIQLSTRADFQFALAPVIPLGGVSAATISALNQNCTYYVRARRRSAAGATGPWLPTQGFRTPQAAAWDTSPKTILIQPAIVVPSEPVLEWFSYGTDVGHPVRALGRDDPSTSFYSGVVTGQTFCEFVMRTAGGPVDTFAVLASNAPEQATIYVVGDNTLDGVRGNSPAYTSAATGFRASANLPGRPSYHALHRLPAPKNYKFWRVVINGPFPGGIFAATYACCGLALATKNHSVDIRETTTNAGAIERDRFGLPDRQLGALGRAVEFDISVMTEEQYQTTYALLEARRGGTGPMLVVPNTRVGGFLHDRILYGDIDPIAMASPSSPRFTISMKVKSLI